MDDGWLFKSMAQAKVSLQLRRKKKSHKYCNNRVRASNGNQQWDGYGLVDRVYTKP